MLIRLIDKLLHLGFPDHRFALEARTGEPGREVLDFPQEEEVNVWEGGKERKKDLREGKISTGQRPPPEAISLARMSTHSSARRRKGSSFDVTWCPYTTCSVTPPEYLRRVRSGKDGLGGEDGGANLRRCDR
jgi:hypothetical protein